MHVSNINSDGFLLNAPDSFYIWRFCSGVLNKLFLSQKLLLIQLLSYWSNYANEVQFRNSVQSNQPHALGLSYFEITCLITPWIVLLLLLLKQLSMALWNNAKIVTRTFLSLNLSLCMKENSINFAGRFHCFPFSLQLSLRMTSYYVSGNISPINFHFTVERTASLSTWLHRNMCSLGQNGFNLG